MLLIPIERIVEEALKYNIVLTGVLHIGAETCDGLEQYKKIFNEKNIVWVEALQDLVEGCKNRGIKKIYNAVISDTCEERNFYRASNVGSSSLLPFGTHKMFYPNIETTTIEPVKTVTIERFMKDNDISPVKLNMLVLNVGGAEMMALKGVGKMLQYFDAIYTKIHADQLYQGCSSVAEMDAYLESKNFGRGLTATTQANWGDALYIRKPITIPTIA